MELARRLPGACVGVGADRFAAGSMILKQHPIDCFVMDDGFQHYQLHRDVNIVTVDVIDPWGGGKLLPAGLLRESPEALRRADLVILTRTGSIGPDRLGVLRAEVSTFMRPNAFVLESRHEPRCLISLADGKE
jgi:tetraacyldisaccharide 4'-kinase